MEYGKNKTKAPTTQATPYQSTVKEKFQCFYQNVFYFSLMDAFTKHCMSGLEWRVMVILTENHKWSPEAHQKWIMFLTKRVQWETLFYLKKFKCLYMYEGLGEKMCEHCYVALTSNPQNRSTQERISSYNVSRTFNTEV